MVFIKLPHKLTENEVKRLNKSLLSNEVMEICGIRDGDDYIVLGVGFGACMFMLPMDYSSDRITTFHTHPDDSPPSEYDLQTMRTLCSEGLDITMEVFTSSGKKYIIDCNGVRDG